jgi:DNA mismatch repair ATPase MutS
LDKYLKVLLHGHRRYVALCEEFKKPDGGFERRVTRVLTPGTLIDEAFINPYENNYILSISCPVESVDKDDPVGLAWMDVSTGEFFSQRTILGSIRDEVVRIGPKEIVLPEALQSLPKHPIRQDLTEEESAFISYTKGTTVPEALASECPSSDDLTMPAPILPTYASDEAAAITQLTTFLHDNLLEHMPKLARPLRQGAEGRMQIDAHTIKSLEIKQGIREGGKTGTLLSVINRTITSSGTRLLSRWICSPSTSLSEISTRQNIVTFFVARPHLRADVIVLLRKIEDTARIVQKFLAGRGKPDDLRDVAAAITCWEDLRERFALERKMEASEQGSLIGWECMDALLGGMASLKELSQKISAAVSENDDESELEQPGRLDPFVALNMKTYTSGLIKWHIKPESVRPCGIDRFWLINLQIFTYTYALACQARGASQRKR